MVLEMRQILVNKLHGNGPLTYCGCHPLDGAVAYIPGNKYAWHAGFQQVRFSGLVPTLRHFPIDLEIVTREQKAIRITHNRVRKPIRVGRCTYENEQPSRLHGLVAPRSTDFQA